MPRPLIRAELNVLTLLPNVEFQELFRLESCFVFCGFFFFIISLLYVILSDQGKQYEDMNGYLFLTRLCRDQETECLLFLV